MPGGGCESSSGNRAAGTGYWGTFRMIRGGEYGGGGHLKKAGEKVTKRQVPAVTMVIILVPFHLERPWPKHTSQIVLYLPCSGLTLGSRMNTKPQAQLRFVQRHLE